MPQDGLAPGSREGRRRWLLHRDGAGKGYCRARAGWGAERVIYIQFSPRSSQV